MEDVDSSTTIAPSPVVHKQQPLAKDVHSRVEDLYPPPPAAANPYNSTSTSVTTDNNNHEKMKKGLPEPSLPCLQKPPEASSVQIQLPPSSGSENSTLQGTHRDVDSATSPVEGRTAGAGCMSEDVTKVNQQTPSKRRRKRVKTTSPKLDDENSNRDKLELKRPVSDDICNWLQLQDAESKELDERLQCASKSHDQSHDLQAVTRIRDSQDTEQSIHHRESLNSSTKQCRLSLQGDTALHTQAASSNVEQQRLSDSKAAASSKQSITCK